VEFCKSYLVVNKEAFHDSRLEVVINDARSLSYFFTTRINLILRLFYDYNQFLNLYLWCCRAELEGKEEKYDVIIGDLADPIEGGPCYKLYTKDFYELSLKPKLKKGGIFVTQVCSGYITCVNNLHIINRIQNVIFFVLFLFRQDLLEYSATQKFSHVFTTLWDKFSSVSIQKNIIMLFKILIKSN
jgi:spermidine synthase